MNRADLLLIVFAPGTLRTMATSTCTRECLSTSLDRVGVAIDLVVYRRQIGRYVVQTESIRLPMSAHALNERFDLCIGESSSIRYRESRHGRVRAPLLDHPTQCVVGNDMQEYRIV